MAELLRVRNLRTSFHTSAGIVRAVDGVSFSVMPGRILGIVGESGSGKTVTSLSIMRLIDAPGEVDSGSEIIFEGRNLVSMDEEQLRKLRGNELSMIFQEPITSLNPVMTIGEQLTEALFLHLDISRREAVARALETLHLVGIPSAERRMADYPHQLSGGMCQRVMIAMALACGPKLLIADEPTTALDVTIQAQILELLKSLRDRLGMAIVLITHDLGVIAEMADDVAIMYAGRVVESGSVGDILDRARHPYTRALLNSIPLLGMTQSVPLRVIRGMVPSSLNWPPGCRFAPRCDHAIERCLHDDPTLIEVGGGQHSACWLSQPAFETIEAAGATQ